MAEVLNPVSPLPASRRLSIAGNRCLPVNDDEAERAANRERRRSSVHGRRSTFGGKNGGRKEAGSQKMSNETLSSLYSSTIKMLQDNKINAKNSWSLNLLDHIDEIIEINDDRAISSGVKTNFQLAGCTLDAGARIYSHRVDSVHNNVFKVRGGLLLGREEEPEGDVDETEVQDGNELRKKAKKKTTQTSTLETNLDNITTTKVEMDYGVDPLFQKMSAAFDEGGAKGMLLNTLSIGAGCEIIFDSNTVFDEVMTVRSTSKEEDEAVYDLGELGAKLLADLESHQSRLESLCPVFTAFREAKLRNSSVDAPRDSEWTDNARVELMFDYADGDFDTSGTDPMDAEAVARERLLMASLHDDDDNGAMDADDATAQHPAGGADVVEGAGLDYNLADFSYFDAETLRGWAGPTHWRYRGGGGAVSTNSGPPPKEKQPRGKTAMLLDFGSDTIDVDFAVEFKPMRGGGELSKAALEKMDEKRNTLPDDLHYKTIELTRLFTRPDIGVMSRRNRTGDALNVNNVLGSADHDGFYDFDNDCDNANFCPEVDVSADLGSRHEVGDFGGVQLSLVEEPEMVAKLDIKYATTAKRLDVRVLKDSIWTELCEGDVDSQESEKSVLEGGKSLQRVVQDLPSYVPTTELSEVSISYVFICLLHLANEKGLRVEGSEDLSDLQIVSDSTATTS